MMTVTIEDIKEAARKIGDHIVETPCAVSETLSKLTGAHVVLKFENLQFTGSFKERGALTKLLSLNSEQRKRGIIAMSAGNHAQAVARHTQRLGVPAVIVMPRYTPNVKVEQTRAFGADVILHGEDFDEASRHAQRLADEKGFVLVHPYDDERIIAGQGTIALEMLAQHPDLEIIVVPIGGGGLISGNAIAAKAINSAIEVVGVEAERFPSMHQALGGVPMKYGKSTIAEGIAVKAPGSLTIPIVRELVSEIALVKEGALEAAVLLLLEVEKTVAEGAGAAGLAALLADPDRFKDRKVGLILSGGNIDLLVLSSIIQRGLVRSGRLVRLSVEVRDVPGALADVTALLGDTDANIVEVQHQRAFTNLPVQSAEVGFVLQTRGLEHLRQILDRLASSGYKARTVETDGNRDCEIE